MTSSRGAASLVTLAGGRDSARHDRPNLPLAALRPDLPWTGPGDGAVPVDEDALSRLALWLADVAAETVLTARELEINSPLADTLPDPEPAPVVPR